MKTVLYSSPFVPAEWIAAHALRPVRIRPEGAAAAALNAPLMGMCPYARAFMAEVAAPGDATNTVRGGSPDPPRETAIALNPMPQSGAAGRETRRAKPQAAAAVFATTCDQMRRAAEWAARARQDQGRAVFLMNVPATWQTPAAARMYRDELQRLGRFLVSLGGTAPSREHLAETMEAYDSCRAVSLDPYMSRVCRAVNPLPSPSRVFDLRERVAEGRVRGCRGLPPHPQPLSHEGRGVNGVIPNTFPDPPRAKPVALVGGPLMRGDEQILQTIADAGGRVVLDGTESGPRTLAAPFDRRRLRDDPLMELVDAYFGAIPDAFRRPDTLLYQWLERELAASAARGIIVWRYIWCDMWAAAGARLRETTGLPVLDLDVSGDEAAIARTAGRIQAFMEVLT